MANIGTRKDELKSYFKRMLAAELAVSKELETEWGKFATGMADSIGVKFEKEVKHMICGRIMVSTEFAHKHFLQTVKELREEFDRQQEPSEHWTDK